MYADNFKVYKRIQNDSDVDFLQNQLNSLCYHVTYVYTYGVLRIK